MIKVGIIGSGGYAAGELIRCLLQHPEVEIDFLYSQSQAGKKLYTAHEDLFTHPHLTFTDTINYEVDVAFLCLGHGHAKPFLKAHQFAANTRIIDLSSDFRLNDKSHDFMYGLVELNKSVIPQAQYLANPGCFATAIQLGLLPLAKQNLLKKDVHVHAITGSTGAGQGFSTTSHFSWRNNNISIYKAFEHQHLQEISQSVHTLQKGFDQKINFIPVRGDFTRGIFATLYTESSLSEEELNSIFKEYYADAAFTFITDETLSLKQVVNTNNCLIQVQKVEGKVLITSAIDNLLKGAAGQAIQNMNLMHGLAEKTGLQFKANYY